jgi:lysophospholipase L1-like esterase
MLPNQNTQSTVVGYSLARRPGGFTTSVAAQSLLVFTSKCVGKPVPYPVPTHPIVVFGDSITEGYGATYKCLPRELRAILPESAHRVYTGDTSYPGDLARMLHSSVLNYGVGGELTSDGLRRLRNMVRSVHPSTVIILEGINDLWGGRSSSDIVGNLSQMAQSVQASGARPMILTVLPVDRPVFPDAQSKVNALDTAIRAMAKRRSITVIDAAARFRSHHPLSACFRHGDGREDGVHPNDTGYRVLGVIVYQALGHA